MIMKSKRYRTYSRNNNNNNDNIIIEFLRKNYY